MSQDGGVAISLEGVGKRFGPVIAVRETNLDIRDGEFFSMLGPSGCGKTTTLRMIAGFEIPDDGRILLRGADVTNVPPNQRNVNTVFQHYALFPHMNVLDNVAYGLRVRKIGKSKRHALAREALDTVRLGHLAARRPNQLSGGQRQRVALARALVREPDLLLLDEPFSALDALTRVAAQRLVQTLWERHRPAVLLVTHDVEESLLLADRILVIDGGTVAYDESFALDRPRRRDDPDLVARRRELLGLLGVDDAAA